MDMKKTIKNALYGSLLAAVACTGIGCSNQPISWAGKVPASGEDSVFVHGRMFDGKEHIDAMRLGKSAQERKYNVNFNVVRASGEGYAKDIKENRTQVYENIGDAIRGYSIYANPPFDKLSPEVAERLGNIVEQAYDSLKNK